MLKPMTTNAIIDKALTIRKGTWVKLIKCKPLANGIIKYTSMTIRLGVDYRHMKKGNPNGGKLPWGEWSIPNLVITHKGNLYLHVANAYTHNTKSWYLKDGKEISKAMVVELIGEEKTSEAPIYNIDFRHIIALGK